MIAPNPHHQQLERFKQAARELECNESEARWDEQPEKVVKAYVPLTEKPE